MSRSEIGGLSWQLSDAAQNGSGSRARCASYAGRILLETHGVGRLYHTHQRAQHVPYPTLTSHLRPRLCYSLNSSVVPDLL